MKKILAYFAYLLCVSCILFLILEFSIRILKKQIKTQGTAREIFSDNQYYDSSGLKPLSSGTSNGCFVQVDEFGFRRFSKPVHSHDNSWLILGDSVTMGIGVEADSTFAGIIQSQFDSVNILNPSVIGYQVNDYYNVFRYFVVDETRDFNIKRVYIFWCLNDVYMNMPDVRVPGGKLRYLFSDILMFIRTHSRFYFFLKTLLFDRPESYYLFDKQFYTDENLNSAIKYFNKIAKYCSQNHLLLKVILLPYEYQFRNDAADNLLPQQLMIDFLQHNNIDVIDLFQGLKETGINHKSLYLYGDGIHFSNLGHGSGKKQEY